MPQHTASSDTLYAVDLGFFAARRGERLVVRVLGFRGRDDAYALVQIVESTLSGHRYGAGREHLIRRERLVPLDEAPRAA